MSGDILHHLRRTNQNPDIQFSAILYNGQWLQLRTCVWKSLTKHYGTTGAASAERVTNSLLIVICNDKQSLTSTN